MKPKTHPQKTRVGHPKKNRRKNLADLKIGHYTGKGGGQEEDSPCATRKKSFFGGGEAIVADAADFGAGDGHLDFAVAGDLFFELFVETGLEFADLAAAKAGDVDVVARAVGFVVVAIAAKVEEIEFVNETFFFEQVDGAVDGDEMDFGADFLGAVEDLINVEMLLGGVHDLEDDAALARETNAALTQRLLEMAGGDRDIDAFAAGDAMGWSGGHAARSLRGKFNMG